MPRGMENYDINVVCVEYPTPVRADLTFGHSIRKCVVHSQVYSAFFHDLTTYFGSSPLSYVQEHLHSILILMYVQ